MGPVLDTRDIAVRRANNLCFCMVNILIDIIRLGKHANKRWVVPQSKHISIVQWKASRWGEGLLWLGWLEEASLRKGGLSNENKFGVTVGFQ